MTGDSSAAPDWLAWHDAYDDPGSPLQRRLRVVQRHIGAWLDDWQGEPAQVVSLCAGQGRDLIEVLAGHPARSAVRARLVELDPHNAAIADTTARRAGLDGVEVVRADAGVVDAYLGALPADLILLCGVFGNISVADVQATVSALPTLCAPAASVIWTRSRREPDATPQIREWFARRGFEERAFDAPSDVLFSVGVHRFTGLPRPAEPGRRLFRFLR
jgi:hypothetical protein